MPRGSNPNSKANLKKSYNGKGGFDTESARKAKVKSDEAKAEKKTFRELAEIALEASVGKDKDGNELTAKMAMIKVGIKKAVGGDARWFELLRDTIGEKPVEKVMVAEIDNEVVDEVEKAVKGYKVDKKGTSD